MVPKFRDIEKGIGGRPVEDKKQRFVYYLSEEEGLKLKSIANSRDTPVSRLVRGLVKKLIDDESVAKI